MQTLNFFLSANGIDKFQDWYLAQPSLRPIWPDLDNYVVMLLSTRWKAEPERERIRILIREFLELHIKHTYNKTPLEIFHTWLNEVNKYCFQGGFGHEFTYPDSPHHWVIRPEFYELVSSIPEKVSIAAVIANQYISISPRAEWQKWSS